MAINLLTQAQRRRVDVIGAALRQTGSLARNIARSGMYLIKNFVNEIVLAWMNSCTRRDRTAKVETVQASYQSQPGSTVMTHKDEPALAMGLSVSCPSGVGSSLM
jgi:hypothetical protein